MHTFIKKTLFWVLAAMIPLGVTAYILMRKYPDNTAATSPGSADPKLRIRRYPRRGGWDTIQRVVEQTISEMTTYGKHWRLVQIRQAHAPDMELIIQAAVPVFLFMDDLQVRVQLGEGGEDWLLNIQSLARVGKSDLGENRRHVLQLLEALDKQLQPKR